MKKLSLLLLCVLSIFFGCKKDKVQQNVGYNVRVNVDDGVSFSLKLSDGQTIPYNVIPPAKNASITVTHSGEIGETLYAVATLNETFKDKEIEVIVTRTDNGVVVKTERAVKSITVPWTVKK